MSFSFPNIVLSSKWSDVNIGIWKMSLLHDYFEIQKPTIRLLRLQVEVELYVVTRKLSAISFVLSFLSVNLKSQQKVNPHCVQLLA